MKTNTIFCLICIIFMLFMAIIIQPITGVAPNRADGIFIAVSTGLWILLFIICISVDSAEYESNIDDLKKRVQELENKLNNTKGEDKK